MSDILQEVPEKPAIREVFKLAVQDRLALRLSEESPVEIECKVASITYCPDLLSDRICVKCFIPDYRDYLYIFARRGSQQQIYAQYVREGEWQAMSKVTSIEPIEYIDVSTVGRHRTE